MGERMKMLLDYRRIARADDLDLISQILFPNNKRHRYTFLVIFVELKWSQEKPCPDLESVRKRYGIGQRSFEIVRAKLSRAGIIERISRFSQKDNFKEGWIISSRFSNSLKRLAETFEENRTRTGDKQEEKDRFYLFLTDFKN